MGAHLNYFLVLLVVVLVPGGRAADFVYIRSGPFGQLITSNTLHWTKASQAKDPVTVPTNNKDGSALRLCLSNGPKNIGLVENGKCTVTAGDGTPDEGLSTTSFHLLSGHAARVKWSPWSRPKSPPPGAVSLLHSQNNRFIAYDPEEGQIGYLESSKTNIGTCFFPSGQKLSGQILMEIEPTGYQLSDIELKRGKGFSEEPVVLATTELEYIPPEDNNGEDGGMTRTEKVLTYQLSNQYDYWGQGNLMAKGLHTTIKTGGGKSSGAESSSMQIIEWGLPSMNSDKTVAEPVWADLSPGTGVNITVRGLHIKGDMTYWATLRTNYKDGSFSIRHIEGQRLVDQIERIQLERSRPFLLSDGSIVTEPTPPAPTTTTPAQTTENLEQQDENSRINPEETQSTEYTANLKLNSAPSLASSIRTSSSGSLLLSITFGVLVLVTFSVSSQW